MVANTLASEAGARRGPVSGQVFDIKRFSTHDGPGIRSTVFLTRCPLRCAWCHNPEAFALAGSGLPDEAEKIREVSVEDLVRELEKDVSYYDRSGGGVTLSGGEPLAQPVFAEAFLRRCRQRDLRTAVDTSGCVSTSAMAMAAQYSDLILYDLKLLDDTQHRLWTGTGNAQVLENLRLLDRSGVEVWIRLPLIPGVNDSPECLDAMVEVLGETRFRRVSLLPYHRIGEGKYQRLGLKYRMAGREPQSAEQIELMRSRFVAAGFETHLGS